MKTKRVLLLLSLTGVALGGISVYLWQRIDREHSSDQVVLDKNYDCETNANSLASDKLGQPCSIDTSTPTTNKNKVNLLAAISVRANLVASSDRKAPMNERTVMPDPQARAVMLVKHKASIRQMFPDIVAVLGIQGEEADELINLLAEHQLESEENPPFVQEGEFEWTVNNEPEWVRKAQTEELRQDREIEVLLGEEKFQEWTAYKESAFARILVKQLQTMLDGTAYSLSDEQVLPLVGSIAEAQGRAGAELETGASHQGPLDAMSSDAGARKAATKRALERFQKYNERLVVAATPYLSKEQLSQFDLMLEKQLDTAQRSSE